MATILTKKSDTASAVPLAADLTNAAGGAELAVNATDKRLFSKTSGGSVVELGTNPSTLVLPSGSANGVAYLNGSKVVTSGSALTFDGTNFVNTAGYLGTTQSGATSSYYIAKNSVATSGVVFGAHSSGAGYIDVINNNPLFFAVNDTEQMRLTSTGLGIGTSSPANKLDVNNTGGTTTGGIRVYATDQAYARLNVQNANGQAYHLVAGTPGASNSGFAIYDATAGATRVQLDSSGNLGLGVTPSAWAASAIDVGGWASFAQRNTNGWTLVGGNVYWDGSNYRYKNSSTAALYELQGPTGVHAWLNAPSGTAGNAITFTQAMTLDANGNLLVGSGITGARLSIRDGGSNDSYFGLGANYDNYFSCGSSGIQVFRSGTSERARIDSSGNFLVGTTSSNLSSASRGVIEVNGASTAYVGLDTGGTLRGTFYSNGSIVGLATATLPLTFGTTGGTEWGRFDSSGNLLVGTTSRLQSDNRVSIQGPASNGGEAVVTIYNTVSSTSGDASPALVCSKDSVTTTSSQRFIQFYAGGVSTTPMGGIVGNGASNVQFATLSDAREKTNIQLINGSLEKIVALKPVEFDWILNGEHCPAGFVAQDVEQVFPEFVIENMANEGQESRKGLTGGMTGGIIPHLVKAIQEQQAIIESLKARLDAANL